MRLWFVTSGLLVACGGDPGTSPSPSAAPPPSTSSPTLAPPSTSPSIAGNPADCARVATCAEAFATVAPAELAAPARIAAEQLDRSIAESPARAAACTEAIASFRADLERLELEVPEPCRAEP